MPMQRKTITVTKQQDSWIKAQIKSGEYGNDSEYLRDLIRKDQEYKNKIAFLRAALIEGEESATSQSTMANVLNEAKNRNNN